MGQVLRDSGAPLEALTPLHRDARSRLRDEADRQLLDQALADNPSWTIQELAQATGLPPGRVKRLLGPASPARRRRPVTGTPAERHDALLTAIRTYAKAMGLPKGSRLSGPAYDEWAFENRRPSVAALVREFGSWAGATRQAGYLPSVTPRRTYSRFSHEEAVATVAAFIANEREQGRPPSSTRYPAWAKERGATSLAGLTKFSRWSEMVTEALQSLA